MDLKKKIAIALEGIGLATVLKLLAKVFMVAGWGRNESEIPINNLLWILKDDL